MGTLLRLESFDDGDQPHAERGNISATYEDGYAAGLLAAEATHVGLQDQLRQELVQAISDAAFGYHEAQAHMASAVRPLLDAMIDTVLPSLCAPALHAQICEIVGSALTADLAAPISLAVPEDQIDPIVTALADLEAPHLKIIGDPHLADNCAWITTPDQETSLELGEVLRAISDHMASLHNAVSTDITTEAS